MSSITRKLKHNIQDSPIKKSDIKLSMIFVCPECHASKVIAQEVIQGLKKEEFQNNKLFICDKCNTKMYPHQVLADF